MGVNGIYGLSGSGLDIESMVKVGMMSKQNEYDKMAQKYTTNEWTKNALVEINNQITTFNMSALTDYKLSSNMNARTAESSNEVAVTATANSKAASMSHRVDVESLSTNAYLISKSMSALTGSASDISLKNIFFNDLQGEDWLDVTRTYTGTTTNTVTETTTFTGANAPTITTNTNKDGSTTSTATFDTYGSNTLTVSRAATGNKTEYTLGGKTLTLTDTGQFQITAGLNGGSTTITGFTMIDGKANLKIGNDLYFARDGSSISYSDGTSITTFDVDTTTHSITGVKTRNINFDVQETYNNTVSGSTTTKVETQTTTFSDQSVTSTKTTTTPSGGTASVTRSATYTDTYGTTYNGTVSNNGKKISFTYGDHPASINFDSTATGTTSVQVITQEYGIAGKTGNGEHDVSEGFLTGNRQTVRQEDTAIAFQISDGDGADAHSLDIVYKYSDILDGKKTINDLVSEINTKASNNSVNVRASYDNVSGRFYLYNSKSSEEDKVLITALDDYTDSSINRSTAVGTNTMDFLNALGLKQSYGGSLIVPDAYDGHEGVYFSEVDQAEGVSGSYGKVRIDGVEYDNIQDNKVTVADVTYNFLGLTGVQTADGATTEPVTVTITQDTESIIGKVKSFIESYNKILSSLYEKYDEKRDSNYKPLTQSQKDSMKEEQIEKWEEKAKQGLLYHDQTLSKIIGQMRNAVSASVEVDGKNYSIYSLGISTTGLKGQLTLNEDKLKAALNENGEVVYNVFAKLTTEDENGVKLSDSESYNKSGIAQRLGDIFTNANKLIRTRAGSSSDISEDSDLNNLLRELQTKMSNFKKMMSAFEDRLYKKYDAMEVALSKLGAQMNFITGGQ